MTWTCGIELCCHNAMKESVYCAFHSLGLTDKQRLGQK